MKIKFCEVNGVINAFSGKGNGIGTYLRQDGQFAPLEVPFTLPGEKITATLIKKRKGVALGKLGKIDEPSALRIAPKCSHFGECGGCRFQHISYEMQLEQKEAGIRKLFHPFSVRTIIPSPLQWGYRNKMEFSFSSDASGTRYLGLVKAAGKRVLTLDECHLVAPWFIDALKITKKWWEKTNLPCFRGSSGVLRSLTMREGQATGDRMVILTYSGEIDSAADWAAALSIVNPKSIYLREQRAVKGKPTQFIETLLWGEPYIREYLNSLEFHISPAAFFQPNPKQAENLISVALELAQINREQVVLDLYCGTGTIGICAAPQAKEVIGIEVCKEAVEDARRNAQINGISNYQVHQGEARRVLAETSLPSPHVVLVNPPRMGLEAATVDWLIETKPPKIVYISCNPATQHSDVMRLLQAGYQIGAIQPVDQFPHTVHVENIILLCLP